MRLYLLVALLLEDLFRNRLWDLPDHSDYIEREGKLTRRKMIRDYGCQPRQFKLPTRTSCWRHRQTGQYYRVVDLLNCETTAPYLNPIQVMCITSDGIKCTVPITEWYYRMIREEEIPL